MVAHLGPPQIRTRKFACIRLLTSHLSPQLHLRVFRCHTGEVLCPRRVPDPQTYDAASPFLHRVQEGLFPRFIDTMGRSDSPSPVSTRFSVASRYHRCVRDSFPVVADAPTGGQGVVGSGLPIRNYSTVETSGSLRFLGNPNGLSPCSSTPVRPTALCGTKCSATDTAPAYVHDEGSRRFKLSGLNHTALGLAVYASQGKSPGPTQDSLLAAGPALPGGVDTRWVPVKGFRVRGSSSFSKLT